MADHTGDQAEEDQDEPAGPPRARAALALSADKDARDDQVVQKANEAIAIRPKRGRLTLLSRRVYNALLYHAQQQGVDERQYTLPLATLVGDTRFNSRNVSLLKDHIREMQTTLIEWHSTSGEGNRWTSTQLLGTVEITERGPGYPVIISWTYPDKVKERLLKPTRYTKILLEIGAQMRSYAAAVLFELGMQYLTSPSKLTMREDLFWWASVLTGRSDIDKVDYRYFKRDVLKPALAELEALQDQFTLELIEHKEGRRISELQFLVHRMPQVGLGVTEERNPFDLVLVERLRKLGLREEDATRLYSQTDEGLLRSSVDHVEARMRNASLPPLTSPAAYLRDALKKRYAGVGETPAGQGQVGALPKPAAKRASVRASVQSIRDEWLRFQAKGASERFQQLEAGEQAALQGAFEASELSGMLAPVAKAWRAEGVSSRIAGPVFYRWLARRWHPEDPTEGQLLSFAVDRGMVGGG